jgi:hypothetical protein
MPNLNFVLMGSNIWDVESAHTGVIVGFVEWRESWGAFGFQANSYHLDAVALREIAKFLDDQDQLRGQR